MILSCPNCATKYTLNEAQLGPRGRTVRCAACKTTWHAEMPEKPIDLSFSDVKKKETVEDLQEVKAKKLPLKYRAILEDKKRMKAVAAQGLVWGGLAAIMAVVLALGFFLRVDIVRAFPRIAGAYAMVGLPTNGTNLQFGSYTADGTFKGGRYVLTIKAQIRNMSSKPTPVPPVRVKLFDSTSQPFDSVLIPPNGLMVAPHQTRTLVFDVSDPKNLTTSLNLGFDLEAMKKMKQAGPNLRVTPAHGSEHGEEAGGHEAAPEAAEHAEAGHEAPAEGDHGTAVADAEPALRSSLAAPEPAHGGH